MNEQLQQLRAKIQERYNLFYEELGIDSVTGIWKNAPDGRQLRFATMPHIGENYANTSKKILFVGLDIGKDEFYKQNCIIDFENRLMGKDIKKCPNAHVAGVMIDTLYLYKDIYKDIWNEVFINQQNRQNRAVINRLLTTFPKDILSNVAQTNFYKFVTIGRGFPDDIGIKLGRVGANDRRFFGSNNEEIGKNQVDIEELFMSEVEILQPEVIWFHGKFESYRVVKKLREQGEKIIISSHPSYQKACTPQYILDLGI